MSYYQISVYQISCTCISDKLTCTDVKWKKNEYILILPMPIWIFFKISNSIPVFFVMERFQNMDTCAILRSLFINWKKIYASFAEADEHEKYPFPCNFCYKWFKGVYGLRIHELSHLREYNDNIQFSLTINSGFSKFSKISAIDDPGRRPFPCDNCDLRFTQKATLINHHNRIHSSQSNIQTVPL